MVNVCSVADKRDTYREKLKRLAIGGKPGVKGSTKHTTDVHDWGTATVSEHWSGERQDVTIRPDTVQMRLAAPNRPAQEAQSDARP